VPYFCVLFYSTRFWFNFPETPPDWTNGSGGQIENANQLLWLASTADA
jgi:hypothetical protein